MTPLLPSHTRFAGLDGLRALAVILVVGYHLFPSSVLRSGFVGVDVFFVISGFLITSLLLRPRPAEQSRAAALVDFWRRRVRRLFPALAVMITVCATGAWVLGGDLLVGIGRQVLGAATFSFNWLSIDAGADYFSATVPELFRNVWSLALEEQFYVLWPLLLPLLLLIRREWARVAVVLVAAAASAGWMTALVTQGMLTRAYFGTDSHAFGLLLGIALALLLASMPEKEWMLRRSARVGSLVVGVIGVAAILVAAVTPSATALAATGAVAERMSGAGVTAVGVFPGILLLAAVGSVLVILSATWPGSWSGRALDVAPLKWIGDRSYALYLWHWPVLVLLSVGVQGVGPEAGVPGAVAVSTLALTVLAAALSYRFVEQPLRTAGFRRSTRALGSRITGSPSGRMAGLGALAVAAMAIGGTTAALASEPSESSAAAMIHAGARAVQEAQGPGPAGGAADAPVPGSRGAEGSSGGADSIWPDEAAEGAPRAQVSGAEITAVGDSVMLASAPSLLERFPGISVDAAVSRSVWAGPGILTELEQAGELREYVVVALGTNGPVDLGVLEQMVDVVGPQRTLILVNAYAPREWIAGVNSDLSAFAASHRGVWVADWARAIEPRTDLLAGDNIHPGKEGGDVFAATVAAAIEGIEAERLRAEKAQDNAPSGRAPRVPFPA